ncbi:MAG TPA: zinc-dependent peptidase [Chitinophagaceae bacterium]|nr:zinc-dependent peptidase [Chitinophagaceae bacterium]
MANSFQRFFRNLFGKAGADPFQEIFSEEPISSEIANKYSVIISRVLPYFNQLNESNKQKFLKRVYNFKKSKSFHFHGLDEQEEVMILISAASIQISFGLKNYLLPFFKEVYILSDAYQPLEGKELYIGHVSPTGIYISWKHFVQGFADYSDGVNVALHEMAHALHHENFIKESGIDWDFRKDFDKLPAVFGPIMTRVIVQRKSYLRGYAFTNFQEFWAVSVEYFFENSQGLKDNLPQLYSILCDTLNQDPLRPNEFPAFI